MGPKRQIRSRKAPCPTRRQVALSIGELVERSTTDSAEPQPSTAQVVSGLTEREEGSGLAEESAQPDADHVGHSRPKRLQGRARSEHIAGHSGLQVRRELSTIEELLDEEELPEPQDLFTSPSRANALAQMTYELESLGDQMLESRRQMSDLSEVREAAAILASMKRNHRMTQARLTAAAVENWVAASGIPTPLGEGFPRANRFPDAAKGIAPRPVKSIITHPSQIKLQNPASVAALETYSAEPFKVIEAPLTPEEANKITFFIPKMRNPWKKTAKSVEEHFKANPIVRKKKKKLSPWKRIDDSYAARRMAEYGEKTTLDESESAERACANKGEDHLCVDCPTARFEIVASKRLRALGTTSLFKGCEDTPGTSTSGAKTVSSEEGLAAGRKP